MKKLIRTGILMAGMVLASQAARAQFAANDLYAGFVNSTTNYVIDLGQASLITGSSTVVDLSSDFSSSIYSTIFGSTSVSMGVVGGASVFGSSYDLYVTASRSGGAGVASTPGSDLSSFSHNSSTINSAVADISVVGLPTAGNGTTLGANDGNSWSLNISPTFTAESLYGATGIDPQSTIDSSGTVYEDLWEATPSSSYTYLGYFKLNTGDSTLTFTPVPEPITLSLLGGGGVLIWIMRRRISRKNA